MASTRIVIATVALSVMGLGLATGSAQAATCGYQEYADGTVGPTVCADGQPNAKVQEFLAKATPKVMALKAASTRKQIQRAVCADRRADSSGSMLYDAVEYQAARFGWSRHVVNPVVKNLVSGTYC